MGRISARLRDKGKDYGEFWGARATGSSDRYEEYTWFIRCGSRQRVRVRLRVSVVIPAVGLLDQGKGAHKNWIKRWHSSPGVLISI